MTTIRYLTVDEWGGVWVRPPATEHLPDGETYVHHVGGGAWMGGSVGAGEAASRQAAISVFLGLNLYATRPRDQGGKGYSFLDYDALGWYDRRNGIGWIAEGRGKYRSAATLDRNEEGEAFCMCGNYTLRHPLDAEIELCARGVAFMADQGWTTRSPTIYGHRDNPAHPGATGCPGDHLYARLPEVRVRAAQLLTPPRPPIPTTPPEDDMAKIDAIRLRLRDRNGTLYDDQVIGLTIANLGQLTQLDADDDTLITATLDADRAMIEAELGFRLTPSKG